jgi:hypothetical protein
MRVPTGRLKVPDVSRGVPTARCRCSSPKRGTVAVGRGVEPGPPAYGPAYRPGVSRVIGLPDNVAGRDPSIGFDRKRVCDPVVAVEQAFEREIDFRHDPRRRIVCRPSVYAGQRRQSSRAYSGISHRTEPVKVPSTLAPVSSVAGSKRARRVIRRQVASSRARLPEGRVSSQLDTRPLVPTTSR